MAASNVNNNNCDPCGAQGKPVKADGWCKLCTERFCQGCRNLHKFQKMSSHHEVIDISDVSNDERLINELEINEYCYKHNEVIKMACRDHSEPCCFVCVASGHKDCKNLVPLDECTEEDVTELDEEDSSQLIIDIDNIIDQDKEYNKKRSQDHQYILNGAEQFTNEFRSRFNDLDTNFKKQVKALFINDKTKRELRIQRFELLKKKIGSKYSTSEYILDSLSPRQKTIFNMKLSGEANAVKKVITELATKDAYVPLRFQVSPYLELIMATPILGELLEDGAGATPIIKTTVGFSQLELNPSISTSAAAQIADTPKLNLMKSRVRLIMKITRENLNLGNRVFLFDGTFLSDGRLVMSDNHNKRIIMFDSQFQLISTHPTGVSHPYGVCTTPDDKRGICVVCDMNKVVTYTLHGGWTEISRFDTKSDIKGLGCGASEIVTAARTNVFVYNQNAFVSKIDTSWSYGSRSAEYIGVSDDLESFYHKHQNDIVGRKFEDKSVIFRYSNSSLVFPNGISCDRNGNILVVGNISKNVFQISSDGTIGRMLLYRFEGIQTPAAICCHPQRDVFVVTSCNEDTVMEVYEFY